MRLKLAIASALMLALFASSRASAQVDVTATAGTLAASYTTLKGAFDAINLGTHQGTIGIGLSGSTTEVAPAVLNASGSGGASYTTITVNPTGGAARTISGAIAAGSPLIDLNGADNVTFNGLNTGGNSLTISNTTVSAVSGTGTIRFQTDATNNIITNCSVLGSATMAVGTNGGNISFASAAIATGNDNNTISNCNLGPAGASLPSKVLHFSGSSNTDPGTANSGIVINNNNIFDYFSATVASAGIDLNSGTTAISITNNRFYQTAARTMTTTNLTHSGIRISNTSGTNYQITGNTIGFASNTGTGTYTLVLPASTSGGFIPINLSVNTTTPATSVQGNTIAAIAISGAGSGTSSSSLFRGIYVSGGLTTIGDVTGNTIGSQSATGSITYTSSSASASDVIGMFNFGSSNWTTSNNNIGGITAANSSTGAANVYGLRGFTTTTATWTCANNLVGGTVANSLQSTSTAAGTIVQGIKNDAAIGTFTSNTVRNLTAAGGTGATTAASVIGFVSTATSNQTLSQNTIFNLSNTNAAAATIVTGIQFTGGTANLVARNQIYGLTTATTSAAAEVNGIRVAGGTTIYRNNMIAIGAGTANAIGAAATNAGTTGINGINEVLGTNSFFHNSVYIGGSPTAGTGASYAFNGTQTTVTRSFRDNIFFNARSNGGATGKNYAVKINGTTPNPTGLTINNNVYFANGTGAVFGFFNSLDVPNLLTWKANVGQDSGSIELNPQYNDPTNATPDLHIHPTNPTPAEANGVDVGVTDDFDGQTRSGLTPVDIGADAGNFVGIDLAAPLISYTPLTNTTSTSNRALAATITDVGSGVPTAGVGLPVIYFRKGTSGAFSSTQSTSGGSGTYNFTIDYSLVTGGSVAIGDTIQYYVVAQDGAAPPNVGSNPSSGAGGFTANPPAAGTPPTTPNSYLISAAITGIKTVCSLGCDFTTLTGATGIFNAINVGVVTGNVEIQIAGDLTVGEDGTNGLNAVTEQPAGSNFTVKIYPTGVARSITGSFAGALIRMNGSSRVTIDGSIGGIGTDRSLTMTNTSVTTPSVVLIGSVGTTPVTNDTLKNCVVINGVNTSSAVVISDATALGSAGVFSNITIQNNDVQKAFIGVFATGGTTPQGGSNLVYTQNTVNTSGANAIRAVALYMQGVNGATVSGNLIGNFNATNDENDVGIWLATGTINATVSGNTISTLNYTGTGAFSPIGINLTPVVASSGIVVSGNTVSNMTSGGSSSGSLVAGISITGASGGVTIEKNKVENIGNTNTATWPAVGINLNGGNNNVVRNNFVSRIYNDQTAGTGAFSPTFGVVGIRLNLGTGHKIYYNSVHLYGAMVGSVSSDLLSALAVSSTTVTDCDIRDNILSNEMTGGNATGGSTRFAAINLPSGGTSAMNLTLNNNAYLEGTDPNCRMAVVGVTAGTGDFSAANFNAGSTSPATNFRSYSSTLSVAGTNDNASLASTAAVPFVSASDLHLAASTPVAIAAGGVPIAGVTTDIDNETRSLTAPSIGADELVADLSITKTDGVATAVPGGSTTYTITASNAGPGGTTGTVADTFPAALTCTWTCVGAGGGICTASGSGNISDPVTLPAGGSVTYTATCSILATATGTLVNTATVTGVAGDPSAANNSATDTDTLTPQANLAVTKTDGVATATPGGSVTYTITASNAGPSNAPGSTVADTFPASLTCTWTCAGAGGGTCTASGSGNISDTVNLPVGGSVTYTASCTISAGATGTLSNTATVSTGGGVTDPVPGNNSATDIDTLSPTTDLAVTKTDGVATATPGGSVTYTITASNAGPSNATGATVADTFPASLTCTWTCVGAGGGTCTASGSGNINNTVNLPVGGSVTYTASCTISAGATGTLVNTATVTAPGGATDPNPGNNSATDSDTLSASADLAITKTDGVTTATPGGSVTYTITASNPGPSNATGATVSDTFPASLTCTWTCVGAGGGTCTASGSGNISGSVNLPSGGSVTFTASCTISPSATGTLSNTATVAAPAGVTDPTPGNNSATDSDTLGATADLAITKTDGVTTATPGGSVTYTITASNAGPSNATGATVADTFPASLTCTWTCVGAGGGTCTASGSGNISGSVNLPSGGSVTYTASCTISPSATGSLSNTATVAAPGGVTDPTPGNNSATDSDTLVGSSDIELAKSVDNPTPGLSTNVVFTVTATNNGPSNATGVAVNDLLPVGLAFVSATPSTGSYSNATGLWTIGPLANGASATLSITATVNRIQAMVNEASKSAEGEVDAKGANNTATVRLNGTPLIDIQISQSVDDDTPAISQDVFFLVTAKNAGPATATGVTVNSNLPSGVSFVSSTPSQGTYTPGSGTWSVGTLASGASATLTVQMTNTVSTPVVQTFTKTAATEEDLVAGNDAASVVLNPTAPEVDLALTKITMQEPVANGLSFSYVIVATNLSAGSATGVVVTDTLPAGVSLVSSAATQGSCSGVTTVTCNLGTLLGGGSATINLVVTKTVGGSVSNTAMVSGNEGDPNLANNTNDEATTPVTLMSFEIE